MDLGLTDQTAVIIGAAQGIGHAIAQAFAAEGCRVGLADRHPGIGDIAAKLGPKCQGMVADVTSLSDMQRLAQTFPDTQHLVYAAGATSGKFGFPFWNLEPGDWPRVLEVNLIGAVNAAHAFAPGMIARTKEGSILFIVSVAGQMGSQTDPPYSASKAALINFTQVAAKDFAPYGIRVNALAPGMVKTELNRAVWEAGQQTLEAARREDYEAWAENKIRRISPLGRWQELPEFGAMATYLASHFARNVTGQTVNVDGGQVMHS